MFIPLLLAQAVQSAQVTLSLRDVVQYAGNLAAVGAFGFAWRTNAELTRIKTVLLEPKIGAVDRIESHGDTIDGHATQLAEHETRLDNHDQRLDRIDPAQANYPPPPSRAEHRR